jgi:hypothetical protein
MQSVNSALERGITGLRLRLLLSYLKLRYRMQELRVEPQGERSARVFGQINPTFELFAEKIPIVSGPEGDVKPAVERAFRAMSLAELRSVNVGQTFSFQVKRGGAGKGEPGVATEFVYAKHYVEGKQKDQKEAKHYDYAVVVEIEFEQGALADLMKSELGAMDEGTARRLEITGKGQIVERGTGGSRRRVFAFAPGEQPPHLPAEVPIYEGGRRNRIVYKIEPSHQPGGGDTENYLVISKRPDDPADVANQVRGRIVAISVLGGVAGQVTPESIQALLSGGRAP